MVRSSGIGGHQLGVRGCGRGSAGRPAPRTSGEGTSAKLKGGCQPRTSRALRLLNRSGLKRASNRQGTSRLGSFPLPRKIRRLDHRARRTPASASGVGNGHAKPAGARPAEVFTQVAPDADLVTVDHVERLADRPGVLGRRREQVGAVDDVGQRDPGPTRRRPGARGPISGRGRPGRRCPAPR